jgi:hypothetical protein
MSTEKLTAKQTTIKIGKLLKGIDNSTAQIRKHQSVIEGSVPELQKLFGGLANSPAPPKPNGQKAPAKTKASPKPAKVPAKATAKTPAKAPAKAKTPAKTPSLAKDKPKTNKVKPPVVGRPALKQAAQNVMSSNGGVMTAADIWKATVSQYGYWSRQSLYKALEDEKVFTRNSENKFSLVGKSKSDDKADAFVADVAADVAISKII